MQTIINWIIKNWRTSVLIVVAMAIVAYEIIAKYMGIVQPIAPDAKVDLVLVLLAGFVINASVEFYHLSKLQNLQAFRPRRSIHPFIDAEYQYVDLIENGIQAGKLEFSNKTPILMATLLRMIDNARLSYDGLNFYLGGWKTGMSEFFSANIGAVQRRVKVRDFYSQRRIPQFCL